MRFSMQQERMTEQVEPACPAMEVKSKVEDLRNVIAKRNRVAKVLVQILWGLRIL